MTIRIDDPCVEHPRRPGAYRRALPDGATEPICVACWRLEHPQVERWLSHRYIRRMRRANGELRPVYESTYQDDRGDIATMRTVWDGQNYRQLDDAAEDEIIAPAPRPHAEWRP